MISTASSNAQVASQKSFTFEERTAKLNENITLGYNGEEYSTITKKDFANAIFVKDGQVTPLELKFKNKEGLEVTKCLIVPIKVKNAKLNEYLGQEDTKFQNLKISQI